VPEMVFVNCCFLGKTDANTEELTRDRYRLAANIGTQLIENGVKAVVAAGWAIDDTAALVFAEEFYHQMFSGNTFGEAVKRARKKVYEEHGTRSNTWGAYQCYGDPFFKLDNGKFSSAEKELDFVMSEEAEFKLTNLINQIESGNSNHERDLKMLQKIMEAAERAGITNAVIREREARVLVMLNRYEEAIEKFRILASSENAEFMVSALEQYLNIRVKFISKEAESRGNDWAAGELENVIEDLKALNRFGKTSERLSLLGSALKRQISIYGPKQKSKALQALQAAAQTYREAFDKDGLTYPLTNWVQLRAIYLLTTAGTKNDEYAAFVKEVQPLLKTHLEKFESEKGQMGNFWDKAAYPNLLLTKLLLGVKGTDVKRVEKAYQELWDWAGNDFRRTKEIEHLRLIGLSLGLISNAAAKGLAAGITAIMEELSKDLGKS
jgi:CHAT domain